MSAQTWKFWIIPIALWGLYSSWFFGYQSGYAEGHQAAWQRAQTSDINYLANFEPVPEPVEDEEDSNSAIRE